MGPINKKETYIFKSHIIKRKITILTYTKRIKKGRIKARPKEEILHTPSLQDLRREVSA